jgi:hypothetical protein
VIVLFSSFESQPKYGGKGVLNRVLEFLWNNPAYIEGSAALLVTVLGGFIALRPPEKTEKRKGYILFALIVLFALVALLANIRGRTIEGEHQKEATGHQEKTASEFRDSLTAILDYVQNPPKQLTAKDISRILATKDISDPDLLVMADSIQRRMQMKSMQFAGRARDFVYPIYTNPDAATERGAGRSKVKQIPQGTRKSRERFVSGWNSEGSNNNTRPHVETVWKHPTNSRVDPLD